jgi:cystine transport system substrate-binding protein
MKKLIGLLLALAITASVFAGGASESGSGGTAAPENALERIKAAGVIKIGTEGTYAPYTYHDESGELVGYDVEVAKAVAAKLGVKPEFIESKWDSLIVGLDSGKWDTVANQVGYREERAVKYAFSIPYTYTQGVIMVNADNNDIKSMTDLKGKRAAQSTTSEWADFAREYGATIVETAGFNESIELVVQGRADVTLNDDVVFYDYKRQRPDAPVKIAAPTGEAWSTRLIYLKGETDLGEAFDKALKELYAEGKLKEIAMKYFGADLSKPIPGAH